jgi:hypothetical protein
VLDFIGMRRPALRVGEGGELDTEVEEEEKECLESSLSASLSTKMLPGLIS